MLGRSLLHLDPRHPALLDWALVLAGTLIAWLFWPPPLP
jgi:hypothetical protein